MQNRDLHHNGTFIWINYLVDAIIAQSIVVESNKMILQNIQTSGNKIYQVIDMFRSLNNEIQAQTIQTFLFVGMSPNRDVPMQDMGKALGLSQASISRNVSFYSKTNRHRSKGVGLLGSREDPKERRRKVVYLTNKGTMFMSKLESVMNQ